MNDLTMSIQDKLMDYYGYMTEELRANGGHMIGFYNERGTPVREHYVMPRGIYHLEEILPSPDGEFQWWSYTPKD